MAGVMAEKLHGTDSALDATLDGHTAGGAGAVAGAGVVVSVEPGAFQTDRTLAGSQISLNTARRFSGSFPIEEWDRYEVLGLIGRGGMGSVYKARDRRLGRIVALKFIRGDDEVMIRRFVQEARAQSRIDHPGVCKVHEVGDVDGKPYIAMQLVEGKSLEEIGDSITIPEKVQLIRDVAHALHAAHELGIIHRDIKPSEGRD